MRRKLIEADVIECVFGLGPNLFYNSPMEACVVICRKAKPKARKGRILFINAVNEVTRERAQSFLSDKHIGRIVSAYREFMKEHGFIHLAPLEEIRQREGNLSIPLYVTPAVPAVREEHAGYCADALTQALEGWIDSSFRVRAAIRGFFERNRLTTCRKNSIVFAT